MAFESAVQLLTFFMGMVNFSTVLIWFEERLPCNGREPFFDGLVTCDIFP